MLGLNMAKSDKHNRDDWADVFTCSWSDDGRLNMNGFHKDSPLCLRLYLRSIKPEAWELALKLIETNEGHSFVDGIGITFPQEYEYSSSEEEENNPKGPIPNDEVEFFAGRLSKCRLKRTDFLRVVNHCLSVRRRNLYADFLKYVSGDRIKLDQSKAADSDAGSQETVTAADSIVVTKIVELGDDRDLGKFTGEPMTVRRRFKAIENEQLRLGDERTAEKQVVVGIRIAFPVTAYQICWILLREQLQKTTKVLQRLYQPVKRGYLKVFDPLTNSHFTIQDANMVMGAPYESKAENVEVPYGDPRAWTREQVHGWIVSQGGPKKDLPIEGDELCRKGRSWFGDEFPGVGQKLCDDLQRRRDAIANERMFGDKRTADKRVVEGTRAAFLVMAYQICMIFYLLGKQLEKASKVLNHLYQLVNIVKRRAADKNKFDPDLFLEGRMQGSIRNRAALDSTQVSLVLGTKCIAIASDTYYKAVTTLCEAMDVIGAPLTIKIKMAFWKKAFVIGVAAAAVGLTAGGAAVAFGASMGAGAAIGGLATLGTVAALAIADHEGNEQLLKVYSLFLETEEKTVEFESNYLKAVLLSTKIVDRGEMTEEELERVIECVKRESHKSVINQVEKEIMRKLPHISSLGSRLSDWSGDIHARARFDYEATAWLHPDSIKDVNDSILIAYIQFGMRDLMRDTLILGVIGPEGNSKKELLKSVFPHATHNLEQNSSDIVLYDGSMRQALPVLLLPCGENAATKATSGLWTHSCSAFICVLDYTSGTSDLRELKSVAELCVPVLLCINTKGTVTSQGEADRAREKYKSCLSSDLKKLVQVVLLDDTERSPWITGTGDVRYWLQDALDHHCEHAFNMIDRTSETL